MTAALAAAWAGAALVVVSVACAVVDRSYSGPHSQMGDGCAAAGFALSAVGAFLGGVWPAGVLFTVTALVAAWNWWRRRRDRKRAPRAAGAKSRARVAALVRQMGEAAKPRPVPRLAPGGAW